MVVDLSEEEADSIVEDPNPPARSAQVRKSLEKATTYESPWDFIKKKSEQSPPKQKGSG
jgi:hypothetical protein